MLKSIIQTVLNTESQLRDDMKLLGQSIDFLEKKIEEILLEIDEAETNHNYSQVAQLKKQAFELLSKLNREDLAIVMLHEKYKRTVEYEKKELLSGLIPQKQTVIWGLPTHSGGQGKS